MTVFFILGRPIFSLKRVPFSKFGVQINGGDLRLMDYGTCKWDMTPFHVLFHFCHSVKVRGEQYSIEI